MKLILKSIVFSLFASMLFGYAVKAILLEEYFENYQLDKPPAGWSFPSAGKWRISAAGSRVLEQADRKASNNSAIVEQVGRSNYHDPGRTTNRTQWGCRGVRLLEFVY
ncbi:MAG: hypothetical protein QF569_10090 [Candidatus Poribacteria bacterium]|jgi:hypothetical protein|nr:hypothetical protein [Candidatus Poribacteria bacterium]